MPCWLLTTKQRKWERVNGIMRIVVKVGTSTLAYPTGRLNIRHAEELVKVLSDLKNEGHEVILVSSGAIGMGVGKLSLSARSVHREPPHPPGCGTDPAGGGDHPGGDGTGRRCRLGTGHRRHGHQAARCPHGNGQRCRYGHCQRRTPGAFVRHCRRQIRRHPLCGPQGGLNT